MMYLIFAGYLLILGLALSVIALQDGRVTPAGVVYLTMFTLAVFAFVVEVAR